MQMLRGRGIDFGIGFISFVRNSNANAWGRGIDLGGAKRESYWDSPCPCGLFLGWLQSNGGMAMRKVLDAIKVLIPVS